MYCAYMSEINIITFQMLDLSSIIVLVHWPLHAHEVVFCAHMQMVI